MYFFIILCLYSQVCNEFFLCVFGLVLVLQYLHSHARRPPAHHHLLGYHGAAFLRCALLVVTTLCAFDVQFGRRSEVVVESVDI